MLTAAAGDVVSTDRLVDQLWEGEPPDAAVRTFRTYVARLRRSLEAAGAADGGRLVVTEAPGYRLGPDVRTDADVFAAAVDEATDSLAVGEPASAWRALDDALGLWSGNAYDEFAHEEWARASAIRLEELRLVARELRIRAQSEMGRHAEAIAEIDSLIAEHPLRETPRRELMIALYRDGRHAEALRAGRDYANHLAEETGLQPSDAITAVEAMILEGDPRLDAVPRGRRLRGYVLEEPIAEDAFGIVYRARQTSIGRDVAITVIPAELADDPAFVRGFESRAQAVAGVEHPGVVPIYDYWREPGGAYLATRHYAAGTLAARQAAGSVPAEEAWAIATRVLGALAVAHRRGVTHGGIGADTVWFDDHGDAVLGGFAMAPDAASQQSDLADLARLVDTLVDRSTDTTLIPDAAETVEQRRLSGLATRLRSGADGAVSTAFDLVLATEDGTDLADPDPTRIVGPNPFKGLAAFSEADAELFHGRSAIVDELAGVLRRRGIAALVGPSGSGKSSVMRAGVLARYRAAGAYVTTMVPGTHPLDELEVALTRIASTPLRDLAADLATDDDRLAEELRAIAPGPDDDVVLAIDQFEELFTISAPAERDRFLHLVAGALAEVPNLDVVATCRADFLGRVLDHPVAGQLLRDRCVLITPLSSEELHDAVIGPAEHAGVAVEPMLVAQIVGDAAGEPGSLPMVQYALTETFEAASDDGVMTLHDYQRLGGVTGVLAQRAEEIFDGLSAEEREAARRLFSRLVAPGDGSEPTRRRALRTELTTVPDAVVDAFGAARLLSFDRDPATREPTVELSHEALIRHWPRLVAWTDEESDGLRLLHHLTASSQEWERSGRDPSLLYRGARLDAAEGWARSHPDELSDLESAYVAAGIAERDAEEQRERRAVDRLRRLTAGLAVFLVLAVVAAGLALSARSSAADRAAEAERSRADALAAEARAADRAAEAETARAESDRTRRDAEVAALAGNARLLAATDPIAAMLLAGEANARSSGDDPVVASALLESLSADPRVDRVLAPVQSTGLVIVPESGPFYTFVRDADEGTTVEVVDVDNATTRTVDLDFSPGAATTDPTGAFLYAVAGDRMRLYEIDTGALLSDQPTENFFVNAAGPGGDQGDVAAVRPDGRLVVYALPDFAVVTSTEVRPDTFAMARSADGRWVATFSPGLLTVWPLFDEEAERREIVLADSLDWAALDPTGDRVAVSGRNGPTLVFDLTDPDAAPVVIEAAASTDLAFGPGGALLAVATTDGIVIHDTATGDRAAPPIGFATGVSVHFTGERTLRAFAPSLGVVAIDLDAPSRVVRQTDIADWGVAAFLAPDRTGAVVIALDESGVAGERWVGAPIETTAGRPLGPISGFRNSRPIGEGRYLTADLATLTYTESDASGPIRTIDLGDAVTLGFQHFLAPRAGRTRDLLILAEGGEPTRSSELVVIDREQGEATRAHAGRGVTAAEFSGSDETEIVFGDVDGRVRWVGIDGTLSPDEVTVGATVGAFAVTADGSATAIGDWSGTVTVLDADRSVIAELANDTPFPIRMVFVDDGDRLAVQSEDGSIALFDVAAGLRIGTLYRIGDLRGAMEVAVDTGSIITSTDTGVVEISVDVAEWQRIACAAVDRRITEVELRAIVPDVEMIDDPCAGFD